MTRFNTKEYLDSIGVQIEIECGEILVYQMSERYHTRIKRPILQNTKKTTFGKSITYQFVILFDKHRNKQVTYRLDRLVYVYFIGDIPAEHSVIHVDGDEFNYLPENLQIVTDIKEAHTINGI